MNEVTLALPESSMDALRNLDEHLKTEKGRALLYEVASNFNALAEKVQSENLSVGANENMYRTATTGFRAAAWLVNRIIERHDAVA